MIQGRAGAVWGVQPKVEPSIISYPFERLTCLEDKVLTYLVLIFQ